MPGTLWSMSRRKTVASVAVAVVVVASGVLLAACGGARPPHRASGQLKSSIQAKNFVDQLDAVQLVVAPDGRVLRVRRRPSMSAPLAVTANGQPATADLGK